MHADLRFDYDFCDLFYINRETSLFYYIMAADAGIEVGSFNAAILCEDNQVSTSLQ